MGFRMLTNILLRCYLPTCLLYLFSEDYCSCTRTGRPECMHTPTSSCQIQLSNFSDFSLHFVLTIADACILFHWFCCKVHNFRSKCSSKQLQGNLTVAVCWRSMYQSPQVCTEYHPHFLVCF